MCNLSLYILAAEYRRDDVLRVESSWHGDYESDSESIDNEMDDPLRSENYTWIHN